MGNFAREKTNGSAPVFGKKKKRGRGKDRLKGRDKQQSRSRLYPTDRV